MLLSTITPVAAIALGAVPADSTARREHIAITQDVAAALGLPTPLNGRRFQVRLTVIAPAGAAGNSANFTVVAIVPGTMQIALYPSTSGTATNGGIYKLFSSNTLPEGAQVTVYNHAPSSTTIDGAVQPGSFTEVGATKSFREIVTTGSDELMIFAPHGGNIEEETSDELASLASELTALGHCPAVWDVQGLWGSGQTSRRWHITAPDINRESFPGLDYLMDTHGPFPYAVALHGFTWDPETADPVTWKFGIVIGGSATVEEKELVRQRIVEEVGAGAISFVIADAAGDTNHPDGPNGSLMAFSKYTELRGIAGDNILNLLAPGGGIQLEQSRGVRETYATEVAVGIANALDEILDLAVLDATCGEGVATVH
jgi:phage replication-related protein YjqB (UPF0714/DUF867 family)